MRRPCKVALAGTHSTGKTSFLNRLRSALQAEGYSVAYVHDSALNALNLGFPILENHTFESTAWLIAEAIRLETQASLQHQIVLVDRPVPDAFGYLLAALRHTGRKLGPGRIDRLRTVCQAWVGEYDLIMITTLDPTIPLGEGRDPNVSFRGAAADAIAEVLNEMAPDRVTIEPGCEEEALRIALETVHSCLSRS